MTPWTGGKNRVMRGIERASQAFHWACVGGQYLLVAPLITLSVLPLILPLPACTTSREQQATTAVPTVPPEVARTLRLGVPDSSQAVRAGDPFWWWNARTLDPLDLQRLAEQEGAQTLLETVRRGGPRAALALNALPWAPDARGARTALCELLQQVVLEDRLAVVQAVHRVLTTPSTWGEELDPGGDPVCRKQLSALLQDTHSTPEERDWASSASAQL